MFTGIVSDMGTVKSADQRGDRRLVISTSYDLATVDLGTSIACSGVCLTVVDKGIDGGGPGWFAVDVSGETEARTAADLWQEGAVLNLERALRLGDELGGHLVTGHVDGVGTVIDALPDGDSIRLTVDVPAELGRYIAEKGSVTLNGVSLTINQVEDCAAPITRFGVNIIPHTAAVTSFGSVAVGQQLNVEIDLLARYLDRMVTSRNTPA